MSVGDSCSSSGATAGKTERSLRPLETIYTTHELVIRQRDTGLAQFHISLGVQCMFGPPVWNMLIEWSLYSPESALQHMDIKQGGNASARDHCLNIYIYVYTLSAGRFWSSLDCVCVSQIASWGYCVQCANSTPVVADCSGCVCRV